MGSTKEWEIDKNNETKKTNYEWREQDNPTARRSALAQTPPTRRKDSQTTLEEMHKITKTRSAQNETELPSNQN